MKTNYLMLTHSARASVECLIVLISDTIMKSKDPDFRKSVASLQSEIEAKKCVILAEYDYNTCCLHDRCRENPHRSFECDITKESVQKLFLYQLLALQKAIIYDFAHLPDTSKSP